MLPHALFGELVRAWAYTDTGRPITKRPVLVPVRLLKCLSFKRQEHDVERWCRHGRAGHVTIR